MAGTLNRRQAALIADLRSRHGRKDSDLCLCDGLRACSEVIRLRPDLLESVILREDFSADLESPVEPVRLSAGEFQKIAQTVHSQGIITVSRRPEAVAPDAPPADPFALVLDQVRDPGPCPQMCPDYSIILVPTPDAIRGFCYISNIAT